MYTIAVQIHGQKQLQRINRELIATVRRQLISSAEVQGASVRDVTDSTWLFPFDRTDAADRRGVVETVLQFKQILEARTAELLGWVVLVEFDSAPFDSVAQSIRETLSPIYHDDLVLAGAGAVELLANHLTMEHFEPGDSRIRRITGRHADAPAMTASLDQLATSDETIDELMHIVGPEGTRTGSVVLLSVDPTVRRSSVDALKSVLLPSDPLCVALTAEFAGEEPFSSIATLFDSLSTQQTPFTLSRTERAVWDATESVVRYLSDPASQAVPQNLEVDLYLALSVFLAAYARRMASHTAVPLVTLHDIDRWDRQSIDMMARAVGRLAEVERPAVVCTASHVPGATLSQLVDRRVRANGLTASRLRDYLAERGLIGLERGTNWQRIARVTAGRADATVHYLTDPTYWDGLDEQQITDVTAEDLAWRAIRRQDSDVREVLFALHYLAPFVNRDDILDILPALGLDGARIRAVLAHLHHLGLVCGDKRIQPTAPSLRRRLEIDLGSSANSVRERIGEALLSATLAGKMRPTLTLLSAMYECGHTHGIAHLYHRLVSSLLDRCEYAEAHRLLYDSPGLPFSADDRPITELVLATNRLRLSLLQQNLQAAGRAESVLATREVHADVIAGDCCLQRARFSLSQADVPRGVALLKQAIVEYQRRDDEVGLARANLDYGILKLAEEDLQGAHDYFRMAAMAADSTSDAVERLRAARLLIATEFISGNLSRVIELASSLRDAAIEHGAHDGELFALFVIARSNFELGRHTVSGQLFEQCRTIARLYGLRSAEGVMQRWSARNLIYEGRLDRAIDILTNAAVSSETQFFLAEALLRRGDRTATLQALTRAQDLDAPTAVSPEAIPWATGFAPLEDLAIGVHRGHRVLWNLSVAFEGYVLVSNGEVEQGLSQLYRLTRDLGMSDLDPNNRIYFYLYSQMIPESGELKLEDPATVLGKAVRYLQQRTSRMEQYNDKTDYLRNNYWNAQLMGRAQVHNLV